MTFKELQSKYPFLAVHDSSRHPEKSDPSAESEWWHNLISYRGYKFASHIHELRYDDGTGKLFIYYSSLTPEQFEQYLSQDDFMGDFARKLRLIYPDSTKIFGKTIQRLDDDGPNFAIFSDIVKNLDSLPAVVTVKAKVNAEDEDDD